MKAAVRAALFLMILLAIPVLPFLWLGESFEQSLLLALKQPSSPSVVAAWTVGLLTTDMFLPVPSSAVITYAGGVLGLMPGAFASWIGLSVGAFGGFGLARVFGDKVTRNFTEVEDIARLERFTRDFGPTSLILTRALPILAEACVLLVGAGKLSWLRFAVPVLLMNALLAITYSACGAYFRDSPSFVVAIVASGAIPLLTALSLRRWWKLTPSLTPSDSTGPASPETDD